MSLDPNKTYLVWNGTEFPNSSYAQFKAPASSTIDWGDGTVETFDTASTAVNTHTYTDGKTEHTIAISGLTSIASSAFMYCTSLTNITIGNSVTIINYQAFYRCSGLTSITIPNSVTSIGNQSFRHCTSLTSVTMPDSVTLIEESAFQNCTKLTQLILFPSTPPNLGSTAIPANVQSIYVQQSSKAAYQAATNWTTFASKIVSDNMYLSFVRFNQKNKEFIREQVNKLSEKLYKHLVSADIAEMPLSVYISIINNIGTTMTSSDIKAYITNRTVCLVEGSTAGIGYITKGVEANTYYLTAFSVASGNELSGLFNNAVTLSVWNDMAVTEL